MDAALSPTFKRYVAVGDSFTEGVGDPDPNSPSGLRGWADRMAEALARTTPDFGYANLAIRGRKLPSILGEQVPAARALNPDLVTLSGGGNDVLRPKVDIDALAVSLEEAVEVLTADGARVVLFTLPDTRSNQAFNLVRGRVALFNEFVREIAERHGAALVDVWRAHDFDRRIYLDVDRLHLNALGHTMMAMQVLDVLGIDHDLVADHVDPLPPLSAWQQRIELAEWLRAFLVPWFARRLTGRSSGDGVVAKRPTLTPPGELSSRAGSS